MNLVDSCGWLEFFAEGPNAGHFANPLAQVEELLVPSITLFEVFKVVLRERGEDAALQAIALMRQGKVVELSADISIFAAKLSHEHRLPLADSVIYATALVEQATVWTQDAHLQGLFQVKFISATSMHA